MQKIIVCGQGDAEAFEPNVRWAAISITDPGKPAACLRAGWGAVLRLTFHDKEDEALAAKVGFWKLFDAEAARTCLSFVEHHQPSKDGLLVHCYAGASRSPALARTLSTYLGLPCDESWPTGSQLVHRIMRNAIYARRPAVEREVA